MILLVSLPQVVDAVSKWRQGTIVIVRETEEATLSLMSSHDTFHPFASPAPSDINFEINFVTFQGI